MKVNESNPFFGVSDQKSKKKGATVLVILRDFLIPLKIKLNI